MTISTTTNQWSYTGDGSTTAFAYDNLIFADTDLNVYVDGTLQTLTTDYTVSGAGESGGGNVTFTTAPASGTSVVIVRDVPDTQSTDYPEEDAFPSRATETALDRLTVLAQQSSFQLGTTFRLRQFDPAGAMPVATADLADLKGKLLRFNASTGAPEGVDLADLDKAAASDATPQQPDTSGGAGSSADYSRGDHTHPLPAVGPGLLRSGDQLKANIGTSGAKIPLLNGANAWSGTQTLNGKPIELAKGAAVASAATTDIWTPADGNTVHITGTATITSLGTAPQAGAIRWCVADGAFTLTHNATSLILPTGANIPAAAGDTFLVFADSTTNMRVLFYQRADGTALSASGGVTAGTTLVQNPLSSGTATTQAHGLGAEPTAFKAVLECLTGEGNWSAGDRVYVGSGVLADTNAASARGFNISADATNTRVITTNNSAVAALLNKTTGAWTQMTNANWKIEVTPYLFS